jgi:hypothetical protein
MAVDATVNIAIVSGTAMSRDLAVPSYTQDGTFRWRRTVSPSVGTFQGDWVAAAPNGDCVAVGHNVTSSGNPIAITMVRYTTNGTLLWRQDIAGTFPGVGRPVVDTNGDSYLAFNSVSDGQDIRLQKHNPAGTLLWSQAISRKAIALNWTNGTVPQTEVRIERCVESGCTDFAEVTVVAGTATTYTDRSLASRTTYTYRVRAFNEAGDSPYSNTATARTTLAGAGVHADV